MKKFLRVFLQIQALFSLIIWGGTFIYACYCAVSDSFFFPSRPGITGFFTVFSTLSVVFWPVYLISAGFFIFAAVYFGKEKKKTKGERVLLQMLALCSLILWAGTLIYACYCAFTDHYVVIYTTEQGFSKFLFVLSTCLLYFWPAYFISVVCIIWAAVYFGTKKRRSRLPVSENAPVNEVNGTD